MTGIAEVEQFIGTEYTECQANSELAQWLPLPPSPVSEFVPPLWFQGGHTQLREGEGGANSDEWADILVLFEFRNEGNIRDGGKTFHVVFQYMCLLHKV